MNFRLNKKVVNNLSVALFLLVVLFFPRSNAYFRFYFAAVLGSAVLLLGSKRMYFDWLTLTGIGVLLISIISILIRFGFIVDPNLRDYTEFARLVLPVVMLIFRDKFKNVSINTIFGVFAFYCSVDFLISILDFINIDFLGLVSLTNSLYVSDYHADVLFRIDGLSAGPGQHGTTMLAIFIFFYVRTFQAKKAIFPLLFSLLAAIPVFLTQSRTPVIALVMVVFSVPLFYLLWGSKTERRRSVPTLIFMGGGGIFLFIQFITYFDRVVELFSGIEGISSFQMRLDRFTHFFDQALEHPAFLLIGYGKNYFEKMAFDNEYLLMFLVHGPVITFVIVGGVITFLIITLRKKKKYEFQYRLILFFLLFSGLIVAFPTTFFFLPVLIPINFIFINLTYWENKVLKSSRL